MSHETEGVVANPNVMPHINSFKTICIINSLTIKPTELFKATEIHKRITYQKLILNSNEFHIKQHIERYILFYTSHFRHKMLVHNIK